MTIWPALSMRIMDFCTNLPTIDSPPPRKKRGPNILEKLLPDLIQVDLSGTRYGLSCGLCSIILVNLQMEEIMFTGNLLFLIPPAINPFWKFHLVWISAELSPNINDYKIFNLLLENQTEPWNEKSSYWSYLISFEDSNFEASQSLRKLVWNRVLGG